VGADWLDGGAGSDTASYVASSGGVSVDLALGTGRGYGAEGDSLFGVENPSGSAWNDVLVRPGAVRTCTTK